MKVRFNRAALSEGLNLVSSVVPARTTKPVLQCVKIVAEQTSVYMSATDFEVGITITAGQAEVEKPGVCVLPADRLAAIVRESVDDRLIFEARQASCEICGQDSHYTILGHEPDQYPQIPGFEGKSNFEMELRALQQAIAHTIFAAARENTRYALNGLLWEPKGKKLTIVGTDGRRLAKMQIPATENAAGSIKMERIIIPAKTMALVGRIAAGEKDTIAVQFVDNQVIFSSSSGIVISSNLVEGNFPKYEDIIPKDYDVKLQLNTAAVLSAVRRAALLVNEESKGIRLSLNKGKIVFSSRAPETGDAEIDMMVDYAGKPLDIGFNPQFLIDMLRVIPEETVEMELGAPDRPGMFKAGKDYIYIVMPVSLG